MGIETKASPIESNIKNVAADNETDNSLVMSQPKAPLHVLLVEDNAIALHFIKTIVSQAGLKFTSATDGEQALALAKSQFFDLIITDIGLPGICGYELTAAIRQWEKTTYQKPIPIIGLTARTLGEETSESIDAGMNKLLSKPISLRVINELINQFIRDC